jgi:hypothetical protein
LSDALVIYLRDQILLIEILSITVSFMQSHFLKPFILIEG